jgi:glutathione S-transferase
MTQLRVHGLDVSYFTGKLEAYLRAKGLAYELVEMDTRSFRRCARITGVAQMPQLELPDGRWLTDSTQIMAHFEREAPAVEIYPDDPALRFIADLLEDFGDEWLWRPAMYYRWSFEPDARLVSDRLARSMLRDVPLPVMLRRWLIRSRQRRNFLQDDGVNRVTASAIEAVYIDVLDGMQTALSARPFLMGERPTQADFGFFGSMFRHFASDPTPAAVMQKRSPRVLEWVHRLWSLTPDQFVDRPMPATLASGLDRLLCLACADYLPYLDANEKAFETGALQLSWHNRNVEFNTAVNPYRVWCLQQLRSQYQTMDGAARAQVEAWLLSFGGAGGQIAASLLRQTVGPKALALALPPGTAASSRARNDGVLNSHWRRNHPFHH